MKEDVQSLVVNAMRDELCARVDRLHTVYPDSPFAVVVDHAVAAILAAMRDFKPDMPDDMTHYY